MFRRYFWQRVNAYFASQGNILNEHLTRISNRNVAAVSGEEVRDAVNLRPVQETNEKSQVSKLPIIMNRREPSYIAPMPDVC